MTPLIATDRSLRSMSRQIPHGTDGHASCCGDITQVHDSARPGCDSSTISELQRSSGWLSGDMARALAATCPPLHATDVVRAADDLALYESATRVTGDLLGLGSDLMSARRIVEALRALRDL